MQLRLEHDPTYLAELFEMFATYAKKGPQTNQAFRSFDMLLQEIHEQPYLGPVSRETNL